MYNPEKNPSTATPPADVAQSKLLDTLCSFGESQAEDLYTRLLFSLRQYRQNFKEALSNEIKLAIKDLNETIKQPLELLEWPANLSEADQLEQNLKEAHLKIHLTQHAELFAPLNLLIKQLRRLLDILPTNNASKKLNDESNELREQVNAVIQSYLEYQEKLCTGNREERQVCLTPTVRLLGETIPAYYLSTEAITGILQKFEKKGNSRHQLAYYKGVYFKPHPDAPGAEFAVNARNRPLLDQGYTPTELIKIESTIKRHNYFIKETIPVLASLGVAGLTFSDLLWKDENIRQYYEEKKKLPLDAKGFSAIVLFSLRMDPYDGKKDNYIAQSTQDNLICPVDIDHDLCYADNIIQRADGKHITNIRCLFYFLPQMQELLHDSIREDMLHFHPEISVIEWLQNLSIKEKNHYEFRQLGLFSEEELKKLRLPFKFVPGTVTKYYQRDCQIQNLLKRSPQISLDTLLKEIDPVVWAFYKGIQEICPDSAVFNLIDELYKNSHEKEQTSQGITFEKVIEKTKGRDLYLMSKLPMININANNSEYEGSYIWIENEKTLYYIQQNQTIKVPINNIDLFKSVLKEPNEGNQQRLTSEEIKKCITLNGGHTTKNDEIHHILTQALGKGVSFSHFLDARTQTIREAKEEFLQQLNFSTIADPPAVLDSLLMNFSDITDWQFNHCHILSENKLYSDKVYLLCFAEIRSLKRLTLNKCNGISLELLQLFINFNKNPSLEICLSVDMDKKLWNLSKSKIHFSLLLPDGTRLQLKPTASYINEQLTQLENTKTDSAQRKILLNKLELFFRYFAIMPLTVMEHEEIYRDISEAHRKLYYQLLRSAYPENQDIPETLKQIMMIPDKNGWRPVMDETLCFLDKEISALGVPSPVRYVPAHTLPSSRGIQGKSWGFFQKEEFYLQSLRNDNSSGEENLVPSHELQAKLIFPDQDNQLREIDLKAEVLQQIQDAFLEPNELLLRNSTGKSNNNRYSRHQVAEINVCDEHRRHHAVYFKLYPEMAGMNFFVDRLHNLLIGHGTTPSTLAKLILKKGTRRLIIPVLISPAIAKKNLSELNLNADHPFDARKFSELLLAHWLFNPNDGALRNFVFSSFPFGIESLTCVDNERYFGEPLVCSGFFNWRKEVLFRSCLYCFDQARNPLDQEAIAAFKAYDMQKLVLHALELGEARERIYHQLFTPIEQEFFKQGEDYCFLQMKLQESALPELMIKLCRLQALAFSITASEEIPDIFELLDPRLSAYYLNSHKAGKTVYDRFTLATGAKDSTVSSTQNLKAIFPHLKNIEQLKEEDSHSLTASKNTVASLEFFPNQTNQFFLKPKEKTMKKKFLGGTEDQQLYHFTVDFESHPVSLEQTKQLFSQLGKKQLQKLVIKHSIFLNIELLKIALASSANDLVSLELEDCENLSFYELFDWLRKFNRLTQLHISSMNQLREISLNELSLEKLVLSNNINLKNLTININLKNLTIRKNSSLNDVNFLLKDKVSLSLEELDVRSCKALPEQIIKLLLINSSSIKYINLYACNLTHFDYQFFSLKELSLRQCPLEEFKFSGPQLTALTLDECKSLKGISLFSKNLKTLSIRGCDQLQHPYREILQNYPKLIHLNSEIISIKLLEKLADEFTESLYKIDTPHHLQDQQTLENQLLELSSKVKVMIYSIPFFLNSLKGTLFLWDNPSALEKLPSFSLLKDELFNIIISYSRTGFSNDRIKAMDKLLEISQYNPKEILDLCFLFLTDDEQIIKEKSQNFIIENLRQEKHNQLIFNKCYQLLESKNFQQRKAALFILSNPTIFIDFEKLAGACFKLLLDESEEVSNLASNTFINLTKSADGSVFGQVFNIFAESIEQNENFLLCKRLGQILIEASKNNEAFNSLVVNKYLPIVLNRTDYSDSSNDKYQLLLQILEQTQGRGTIDIEVFLRSFPQNEWKTFKYKLQILASLALRGDIEVLNYCLKGTKNQNTEVCITAIQAITKLAFYITRNIQDRLLDMLDFPQHPDIYANIIQAFIALGENNQSFINSCLKKIEEKSNNSVFHENSLGGFVVKIFQGIASKNREFIVEQCLFELQDRVHFHSVKKYDTNYLKNLKPGSSTSYPRPSTSYTEGNTKISTLDMLAAINSSGNYTDHNYTRRKEETLISTIWWPSAIGYAALSNRITQTINPENAEFFKQHLSKELEEFSGFSSLKMPTLGFEVEEQIICTVENPYLVEVLLETLGEVRKKSNDARIIDICQKLRQAANPNISEAATKTLNKVSIPKPETIVSGISRAFNSIISSSPSVGSVSPATESQASTEKMPGHSDVENFNEDKRQNIYEDQYNIFIEARDVLLSFMNSSNNPSQLYHNNKDQTLFGHSARGDSENSQVGEAFIYGS